jgi:hypothetical protein
VNPFWSYLLTAVGIFGLWLAGRASTRAGGWAVGIGAQTLWIAYAVSTEQWGFIASALLYGSVYIRNFILSRKAGTGQEEAVGE